MVKVINIDTKTRTIRVENADSDIKTWRTTESGAHFPIKKGESTKEALDKFVAKKRPETKKDEHDLKFASQIKKGDIVSAGGRDYKIIQADRNWVIGLADNGLQLKINTETSFDTFKVKKQQSAKKESGLDKDKIKAHKQGLIYYDDYAKQQSEKEEKARKTREKALKDKEDADFHEWQKSNPSKKADVSDIIKSYKEKMAALGPKASIKKTDRVEADAIKEFMTRKLGANRPYDDYYQYWLNGMDKKTRAEFEEIYNESEAREMAFSELASDVDHSGLARGEPTYDELMQWAEEQKAKKQTSQKETKSSKFDSRTLDRKLVRGGLSDSEIDDLAKMQDYYDISDETINAAIDAGEYSVKEIFKRLRNYDDDFATHLSDFREDYQKSTKQPKQSSQPTSYDLDDAFDEADLGSEWSRAKHRMDFHGVSQYTIKDIIDSGKYEAGDIIEALQSSSHDKIDEMRKSLKNK